MVCTREHTGYAAALRRLFGAAALLGLFAMHGLAAHGTAHAHAGEPTAAAAGHVHSAHSMTMNATVVTSVMSSAAPSDPAPDHGLLDAAAMCLAVLLIGAIVAVLSGRGFVPGREPDLTRVARGWPARARGDRDPPCLFALSIQRC